MSAPARSSPSLVAIVVCIVVAVIVGLGLVRSGAQSGAVAATVITLALLFVVHEVAVNWTELTGGDRAGLSFSVGEHAGLALAGLRRAVRSPSSPARVFARVARRPLRTSQPRGRPGRPGDGHQPAVPQMVALVLSVAIVAVGASLRVYELGTITPKFFFLDYTLLTLVMLIVGGRNSVTGALIGVVVITAGNELTRYLAGPDVEHRRARLAVPGRAVRHLPRRGDARLHDPAADGPARRLGARPLVVRPLAARPRACSGRAGRRRATRPRRPP